MIALALQAVDPDFTGLARAVESCDRTVVTRSIAVATKRHSDQLLALYAEQRDVAAARATLAERRRRLHAGEKTGDTEPALTLAAEALDDRGRALADARALDATEQEMLGYFRGQYIAQCSGKVP